MNPANHLDVTEWTQDKMRENVEKERKTDINQEENNIFPLTKNTSPSLFD